MSQRLAFIRPALAVPAKSPPKGDQWVHEAKWDGFRIQVVKDGSDVRLYSKNGAEWTKKLPAIVESFRGLPARSAILDGELCHSGASGRPDFRALMREMRSSRPDRFQLVVYAFDLLHLNGVDLRPKPFSERRRKLAGLDKPCRACSSSTSSTTATTSCSGARSSSSRGSCRRSAMRPT